MANEAIPETEREAMIPPPPRNIREGDIADPPHTEAAPMETFKPDPEKQPTPSGR